MKKELRVRVEEVYADINLKRTEQETERFWWPAWVPRPMEGVRAWPAPVEGARTWPGPGCPDLWRAPGPVQGARTCAGRPDLTRTWVPGPVEDARTWLGPVEGARTWPGPVEGARTWSTYHLLSLSRPLTLPASSFSCDCNNVCRPFNNSWPHGALSSLQRATVRRLNPISPSPLQLNIVSVIRCEMLTVRELPWEGE